MRRKENEGPEPQPASVPAGEEHLVRLLELAGSRPTADREATDRIRAAVHRQWNDAVRERSRRRARGWALAAAAVIVAALWAGSVLIRRDPLGGGAASIARVEALAGAVRAAGRSTPLAVADDLVAGSVVETGAAARLALRTSGGYAVRLDVATTLRLVSPAVLALERGSIYLDSGGASDRTPLVVRTGQGEVHDIGTQFEIRLEPSAMRVLVREGAIEVRRDGRSHRAESGVELTVDPSGVVARQIIPTFGPEWSWIHEVCPTLDIDGRPLGEFLDWVSRESGRKIAYADGLAETTAGVRLNGSIAGMTPDEALGAVLPTCGLGHRIDGAYVIIDAVAETKNPG